MDWKQFLTAWQQHDNGFMAASLMPARSSTAWWHQVKIFGQLDNSWQQVTMVILNMHIAWCFRVLCALGNVCIRCWKIWEVFFELPSSYGLITFVYFHIIMIMVLWYWYCYLEVWKVKSLLGAEHHMAWCNSKSARVWIFIGLAYKLVTGNHQQIITIIHQQHHLNIWKVSWDPLWPTKKCNKGWTLS